MLVGAADTFALSASMAATDTVRRTSMAISVFPIWLASPAEWSEANVSSLAASGTAAERPVAELCGIFGDAGNQAADVFSDATSIPTRNVTPLTTCDN